LLPQVTCKIHAAVDSTTRDIKAADPWDLASALESVRGKTKTVIDMNDPALDVGKLSREKLAAMLKFELSSIAQSNSRLKHIDAARKQRDKSVASMADTLGDAPAAGVSAADPAVKGLATSVLGPAAAQVRAERGMTGVTFQSGDSMTYGTFESRKREIAALWLRKRPQSRLPTTRSPRTTQPWRPTK
jgi:hypothetical protein